MLKNLFESLHNKLSFLKKISFLRYCLTHYPKKHFPYIALGIYCIFFTITTMYVKYLRLDPLHHSIILGLYQAMLILSLIPLSYPLWTTGINSKKKEQIAQILYPVIIFLILIVANTFFVFVNDFDYVQSTLFAVNLIIASILLGCRVAPTAIIFGLSISLVMYKYFNPIFQFSLRLGSPIFF